MAFIVKKQANLKFKKNTTFKIPRTGTQAFLPSSLGGLSLWLKADAGVTLAGSNVTAWADQSENGFDVAPDYASSDITWESSVAKFNNLPAIYFETASEDGDVGLFNTNTFITKSLFIVYSLESVDDFEYSVIYENNGINTYTSYSYGNRAFGGYFNEFIDSETLSTISTAYIRTIIADDDGEGANPIDFFVDGDADGSLNGSGFYNFRSEIVIGNGGARTAGPSPSIDQPFQGYIAEIVAYDVVLTIPEIQQVEAYLNSKYQIY